MIKHDTAKFEHYDWFTDTISNTIIICLAPDCIIVRKRTVLNVKLFVKQNKTGLRCETYFRFYLKYYRKKVYILCLLYV